MRRVLPILLALGLTAALPARAELELTPSLGLRLGGQVESGSDSATIDPSPALGLTLDIGINPEKWIAVLWSHQSSGFSAPGLGLGSQEFELEIDYLHAGGVYRPERGRKSNPFVMATAGFTFVRPAPSGFENGLGLSGMIGGGTKIELSKTIGLRVEGRAYLTFTNISMSGICGGVGCNVKLTGFGVLQFEILVGPTFSF